MATLMAAAILVTGLRTEYRINPVGIDIGAPRLSWRLDAGDRRGVMQTAYQIQVAVDPSQFDQGSLWDSGRIDSPQSTHVVYAGPKLESRKRYFWRVRIWDESGSAADWSEPAFWEMGLLGPGDWSAEWITVGWQEDTTISQPAPLLRTSFEGEEGVLRARLYVTSLGLYEVELNGEVVGDAVFTPGWTSYDNRLEYVTYDVTDDIREGDNTVLARLGDGWYRGYLGWKRQRNLYGSRLALLAQLEIEYEDGSREVIATGPGWEAATGAIRWSDIYMGETYDARLEGSEEWTPVALVDHTRATLVAVSSPPVRRTQELTPVGILESPSGNPIVDMGQNMVGRVRMSVRARAGTEIRLRHAEVLNRDGSLYLDNLRTAKQEVAYIAAGRDTEVYEPTFTFQGFRYVEVVGWPGDLTVDDIRGIVIHSNLEETGTFETSNRALNRLHENFLWGQRGNFLDVPTDCPQRDERMGWTGDAQVFAPTAAFNMLVAPFFERWLQDLAADQLDNGSVPWVIPDMLTKHGGLSAPSGAAGWGDAATVIPWVLYERFGDTRVLESQYESMKRWVDFIRSRAGDDLIWSGDAHFGDWLAFAPARSDYPGATTSKDLVATAYFAHSVDLLARTATVLGREHDRQEFTELLAGIRAAFQREFITEGGRLVSDTQTGYVLALAFGLAPDSLKAALVSHLADNVRRHGHMTTGFLGTPLLLRVLSDNGELDLAYQLLLRDEYPSWLYPVKAGATTIWERWDSQKPDGSFQDAEMNSFNHYAYGAVGDWMYRVIGGIEPDPDNPGYGRFKVAPRPGGGIDRAAVSLQTLFGKISSSWRLTSGTMTLEVAVPSNTRATIELKGAAIDRVTEGGRPVSGRRDLSVSEGDGEVVIEVGSGRYEFVHVP